MKALSAIFASLVPFALALTACSSNSNGGGGGGSPVRQSEFEKATSGSWISECLHDAKGNYKDQLVLADGGSGSTTFSYYAADDCSGDVLFSMNTESFRYVAGSPQGNSVPVTLKFATQQLVVQVQAQGDTMVVTSAEKGAITYTRVGGQAGQVARTPGTVPPPGGPISTQPSAPGTAGFEAVAVGSWITKDCYQYDATQTQMVVITYQRGGVGQYQQNIFANSSCSGEARAGDKASFTYTVDNYANGGGQLTFNGNNVNDVTFQGNQMTMTSQSGSVTYIRVQ